MSQAKTSDVAARVRDGERLDRAILAARRRVLRFHRQAGIPLVIRQGSEMVEVAPDAIDLPDEAR